MHKLSLIILFLTHIVIISCKEEVFPKPKGMLNLTYTKATYIKSTTNCDFDFEMNANALLKPSFNPNNCGYQIEYPKLKATVYLTHREINNDLKKLLIDSQNLTQEHVIKADEIITQPYINKKKKIYGMLYEVSGNAASPSQFYLTDSIHHFLLGSVYFNTKPNYDSIYPAIKYIQKDVKQLMESVNWK